MPLRQRRLCFRPAVVVLSSGAKTDHSELMRTRATLAVSPWLFIRWSSLPIRKTSELPDFRTSKRIAASGEASAICTQWGFPRSDGTEAERGKEVGRRCCFATVGSVFAPLESTPPSGENRHRRGHCAEGAFRQHRHCVLPRGLTRARRRKATFAKSDVREPIKGSRRFCRVAMATYEDANRSGGKICTMRYLGRVAMGNFSGVLTCWSEKEPIMASQLVHAPRRQCRFGHFSGGVDRTYGETTHGLETSESGAVVGKSPRKFSRRNSSTQADRKPSEAK